MAVSKKRRGKSSARLIWDSKPKREQNPKNVELKVIEIVFPSAQRGSLGEATS